MDRRKLPALGSGCSLILALPSPPRLILLFLLAVGLTASLRPELSPLGINLPRRVTVDT